MKYNLYPQHQHDFLARLDTSVKARGGNLFFVGGCVRDALRGNSNPSDTDILVVRITDEQFREALEEFKNTPSFSTITYDFVGKSFGVYKVSVTSKVEGDYFIGNGVSSVIDFAFPRKEVSTGDGHRDFENEFDPFMPIEEDLARRDFTMNAIAISFDGKTIVDPFKGRTDINKGILRSIGTNSISEDYLRALRGVQFVARFNLYINADTLKQIQDNVYLIDTISEDRIRQELAKLLKAPFVHRGFELLKNTGLLQAICEPLYNCNANNNYNWLHHKYNTYCHTIQAIDNLSRTCDPVVAVAAMLHDIGKPLTESVDEYGIYHNYRHEEASVKLAKVWLESYHYSNDDTEQILWLIANHMGQPHREASPGRRKQIKKLLRSAKDKSWVINLFLLKQADSNASLDFVHTNEVMDWISTMTDIIEQQEAFSLKDLQVHGFDMLELGLKGPAIGHMLNKLLTDVIEGDIVNERDALLDYVKVTQLVVV